MDDVRENDQCLFYVAVTVILMAENMKELESMAISWIRAMPGPSGMMRIIPCFAPWRKWMKKDV